MITRCMAGNCQSESDIKLQNNTLYNIIVFIDTANLTLN